MHLDDGIGLKKMAREKHVFTLQAIDLTFRLESGEQNSNRRLRWPAHSGVGKTPETAPEVSEIAR